MRGLRFSAAFLALLLCSGCQRMANSMGESLGMAVQAVRPRLVQMAGEMRLDYALMQDVVAFQKVNGSWPTDKKELYGFFFGNRKAASDESRYEEIWVYEINGSKVQISWKTKDGSAGNATIERKVNPGSSATNAAAPAI
jgi:hypothetical protein